MLPKNATTRTITLCYGGSVTVGSHTYATSGTYNDTLTGVNTCDSIVTTNLTINPQNLTSQTITLCYGGSVNVGSHTYTASGTYNDTLTGANTCDSIVTTNLTINPQNLTSQTITLCFGQSITVGPHSYNKTATYNDTLSGANGCDSIVITNLNILPKNATTRTITLCYGGSVTVGSHTYTASGTYNDTLTGVNTCDSIVTTNLTINPQNVTSQTITLLSLIHISEPTRPY